MPFIYFNKHSHMWTCSQRHLSNFGTKLDFQSTWSIHSNFGFLGKFHATLHRFLFNKVYSFDNNPPRLRRRNLWSNVKLFFSSNNQNDAIQFCCTLDNCCYQEYSKRKFHQKLILESLQQRQWCRRLSFAQNS